MLVEARPKLGLLNIMPYSAYLKTEHQWRDSFEELVDIVPVRFDEDPRINSRVNLEQYTVELSSIATSLDGIILTGANLELDEDGQALDFGRIDYINQLKEVIDWTSNERKLSIFSCLSAHIALKHLFDIDRTIGLVKTLGVYEHEVKNDSELTEGLASPIMSPHSRWGNIGSGLLEQAGIKVIIESEKVGWLISECEYNGNKLIFMQGHPEYQRDDLHAEYKRDISSTNSIPYNYYPEDNTCSLPKYSWHESSDSIFRNIATSLIPLYANSV